MITELRKTLRGVEILSDWLGSGGEPVAAPLAQSRAAVCETCQENRPARWWETASGTIAQAIRDELEAKNQLNLTLPNEEALGMCRPCGCCNRLAPWSPIEHIKSHTSVEVLNAYPAHCWKKKEIVNAR